jgi:hypothetical protein
MIVAAIAGGVINNRRRQAAYAAEFTKAAAQYGAGMRIGLYNHDALADWASHTCPPPWM